MKLYDLINRNDLFQIIKSPTRITDQSSSLLDLIITDAPQPVNCSGTLAPIGSRDHYVVFCRLKLTVVKPNSYKRQVWNYNSADWTGLSNALDNAPFDTAYTIYEDINDIVHYWTNLVTSTCAEFIPSRSVTIRARDKPWVTNELRWLIRKRNRCWKRFKKSNNQAHFQIYKRVRNATVLLNRKCIKDYAVSIDTKLQNSDDPKIWWHNVKALLSSKAHLSIPPILINGKPLSSNSDKADAFNRYFISQCNLVNSSQKLPPFHYITGSKLLKIEVSEADVLDELNFLRINKATGPDGVGNVVLKRTAKSIYKPLTRLFNYSLHRVSSLLLGSWLMCVLFSKKEIIHYA